MLPALDKHETFWFFDGTIHDNRFEFSDKLRRSPVNTGWTSGFLKRFVIYWLIGFYCVVSDKPFDISINEKAG